MNSIGSLERFVWLRQRKRLKAEPSLLFSIKRQKLLYRCKVFAFIFLEVKLLSCSGVGNLRNSL